MTECIFCARPIKDFGLGWYEHVGRAPTCNALWSDWIEFIHEDHPDG